MSDSAVVLVCNAEEPFEAAAAVIALLVEREIIEAMPTDSALGALGHRPGKKWKDAVNALPRGSLDLTRLRTNGMEVETGRGPKLYVSLEGDDLAVECPDCGARLDDPYAHLEPPSVFEAPKDVTCARCKKARPISAWIVRGGAFGNVAFTFWNWPRLKSELVRDVEAACGAPVTVVAMRL